MASGRSCAPTGQLPSLRIPARSIRHSLLERGCSTPFALAYRSGRRSVVDYLRGCGVGTDLGTGGIRGRDISGTHTNTLHKASPPASPESKQKRPKRTTPLRERAERGSASLTSSRLRLQVFARRLTVAHHRLKRSGLPKSSCRQFRRLTTKSCPGQSCASHGMLCRRRRWIARRPNANATRGPVHCLHNPDPEL